MLKVYIIVYMLTILLCTSWITNFLVASVQVIIPGYDTEFSTEDLYFILLTLCSPNYSYEFEQSSPN